MALDEITKRGIVELKTFLRLRISNEIIDHNVNSPLVAAESDRPDLLIETLLKDPVTVNNTVFSFLKYSVPLSHMYEKYPYPQEALGLYLRKDVQYEPNTIYIINADCKNISLKQNKIFMMEILENWISPDLKDVALKNQVWFLFVFGLDSMAHYYAAISDKMNDITPISPIRVYFEIKPDSKEATSIFRSSFSAAMNKDEK